VLEDPAGDVVGRPPEPYPVGTVARIVNARRDQDGRIFILCLGRERIRLRHLIQERPYLVGEVEVLEDEDTPAPETAWADLNGTVQRAIDGLLEAVREATPPGDLRQRLRIDAVVRALPTDPLELSFFIPRLLARASAEERQRLLDAPTLRQRLRLEQGLLAREQLHVRRLKRSGSRLRFDVGLGAPSLN
jgi:Lon protease-like protein